MSIESWSNCPLKVTPDDARVKNGSLSFCQGCHTLKTIMNATYTLCSSCRGKYVYHGENCDVPSCEKVSDGSVNFQSKEDKLLCGPCYNSWQGYNSTAAWDEFVEIRTSWLARPRTFQNIPEELELVAKDNRKTYKTNAECQKCNRDRPIENCEYQLCGGCTKSIQYYGETCWCCGAENNGDIDTYWDTKENVFACQRCLHKTNRYNTTYSVLKNHIRTINNCQVCNIEVHHDKKGYITQGVACIDHDHDTGKIRGVLCHRCNKLEGAISNYDCPEEWLQNLLNYLVKPPLSKPGIQ